MIAVLVAAVSSFAVLALMFVPLERAFPARVQAVLRPGIRLDLLFFFGQYFVFNGLSISALECTANAFGKVSILHAPSLASLPPWIQVAFALVAGDFVVYWFHRACHTFDFLWRFHAVHHSSEHLDWLAAHREHPIDGLLTQLCMNLPAFALGVPVQWLAGIAVFRGVWAIFVHSNVRVPLGPLRWILGAPDLHHWHHARTDRTTHNFANLAPWLDLVFGTHHHPKRRDFPLGNANSSSRAHGYIEHLVKLRPKPERT